MRKWISLNPKVDFMKDLRAADRKKLGLLRTEVFYRELSTSSGLRIDSRDQILLNKALLEEHGDEYLINYISFYFLLKNLKNN
jgi:beta-N-acetylglucosaminidase